MGPSSGNRGVAVLLGASAVLVGQHGEGRAEDCRAEHDPGPPIGWVISSIARPNSAVDRPRAQFRPWPLARAIHSHSATGTRPKTIVSVQPRLSREILPGMGPPDANLAQTFWFDCRVQPARMSGDFI